MATKTFKIGEYAKGGVITAEIKGDKIALISKLWDDSKGYRKSSNQSNATEMYRIEVISSESEAYWKLFNWLCEESTSYWADEILTWVKSKTKLESNFN